MDVHSSFTSWEKRNGNKLFASAFQHSLFKQWLTKLATRRYFLICGFQTEENFSIIEFCVGRKLLLTVVVKK